MTPTLLEMARDYWLMGNAGGHVLQLIGILDTHNRILADTISLHIDMEAEERREYVRLFHERIELARGVLGDTFASIDALLEMR